MKFLIDFFVKDSIHDTMIFPLLNCSKHEATILRDIIFLYMRGENEIEISSFLEQMYFARGFEVTPYLKEIKNLIELGWLHYPDKLESALELQNSVISLSKNLLKLLEKGCILNGDIEPKIYNNSLEYLQDEWQKINLLLQYNRLPANLNHNLLQSCDLYIETLTNTIDNNVERNGKKNKIREYFHRHRLNNYERLIFLLLAQAQYNGDIGLSMKEIITLGKTGEEKSVFQSLLTSKSKLLKNGMVTPTESYTDLSFMEQEFCIPQHIFSTLVFEKSMPHLRLEDEIEKSDIFDIIIPKKGLSDIILQDDLQDRFSVLLQHLNPLVHKRLKLWGIKEKAGIDAKILLYGESGTGKTSSAYALAKDLRQKILSLDCSKILSMYVGESEKNVRRIFDEYILLTKKVKEKPILLLDEADQLLSSRNDIASSASRMYHQMQNIFLEQIEKFEGILIATTNLVDSLDSAFSRRFHYKLKFERPNMQLRIKIWDIHLPKNAIFNEDRESFTISLAKFDLSGGQIKIVIENTCYKVATRKEPIFYISDFIEEIEKEKDAAFGDTKKMGFLY